MGKGGYLRKVRHLDCFRKATRLVVHAHRSSAFPAADLSFLPAANAGGYNHRWIEPIACMWRTTRNNGITEGFHRKMKLIQRRAYGFRNFENYRLRVIAQCG